MHRMGDEMISQLIVLLIIIMFLVSQPVSLLSTLICSLYMCRMSPSLTFIMTSSILRICPSPADNGTPLTLILVVSDLCLAGFMWFSGEILHVYLSLLHLMLLMLICQFRCPCRSSRDCSWYVFICISISVICDFPL